MGIPVKPIDFLSINQSSPLEIDWDITNKCNLKCIHCYLSPVTNNKELTFNEIIHIIDQLCIEGCLGICFTGGEPFIRNDFMDIYIYAVKKGFLITLFTNGTLITPQIIGILKKYPPLEIEITINGLYKETYEYITQKPGSYFDCLRGINLVLEGRLPLTIKSIGMKANKDQILKIKRWALCLGDEVKYRFDSVILPKRDGSKEVCKFRLSPEEISEIEYSDSDMLSDWKNCCKVTEDEDDPYLLYNCGAGVDSLLISPFGEVQVCSLIKESSMKLRDSTFKECLKEFLHIQSEKYKTDSKCIKCSISHLCRQCPGRAYLENGDKEKPVDYFCQLARKNAEMNGIIYE